MRERRILRTREFMQLFLTTDTFDGWQLSEAQIACANTWTIDGHINREYFRDGSDVDEVPSAAFVFWAQVRPVVLSLIRGKQTPLSFTFMLIPPETVAGDADTPISLVTGGEQRTDGRAEFSPVMRVRFTEGHVYAASAVSMRTFSLDKEPERTWDKALSHFFDHLGIAFEEL